MKLIIDQPTLALGLSHVARAVSTRSTLPVLSNVLIRAINGHVELLATDLEIAVRTELPGRIEEQGAVTVPARTMGDLIKAIPNEPIKLALKEESVTLKVSAGKSSSNVKGIMAEEFPLLPEPDEDEPYFPLPAALFRQAVAEVAFAASDDAVSRPTLAGVLLTIHDGALTLAATDGFRLSTRSFPASTASTPLKMIIPKRALNEVMRLMPDGLETVRLVMPAKRSSQVVFELGGITLVAQLIEGNFPDYGAVIPKSYVTEATVERDRLLHAVKLANVFARDASKTAQVVIGDGGLKVSAEAQETGSNEIELEAAVTGPTLEMRLNTGFLQDAVSIVAAPQVILQGNSPHEPFVMRSVEPDNDWLHLIMPMNVGR